MTQSCKNCGYARFSTGPAGECTAPSPITGPQPIAIMIRVTRYAVWKDGGGETCPAWIPQNSR